MTKHGYEQRVVYVPGLRESNSAEWLDVTTFSGEPKPIMVHTAKWWMRPICWITRRPTRYYE